LFDGDGLLVEWHYMFGLVCCITIFSFLSWCRSRFLCADKPAVTACLSCLCLSQCCRLQCTAFDV